MDLERNHGVLAPRVVLDPRRAPRRRAEHAPRPRPAAPPSFASDFGGLPGFCSGGAVLVSVGVAPVPVVAGMLLAAAAVPAAAGDGGEAGGEAWRHYGHLREVVAASCSNATP